MQFTYPLEGTKMGNAFERLIDFVKYVEDTAENSKYGFDPGKASHLRAHFVKLKTLAEQDMGNFTVHDLEFLEGTFETIITEAESRFKVNMTERNCRNQKILTRILLAILGTVGTILVKCLLG